MDDHNPAETEPATPQDTPEGAETPEEAQRRKFREALDKKKFSHHGPGMNPNGGVQSAHTGPAVQKRMHRRKSG
ncbi:DUF5302 domain-containing protein [Leucobacter denitrificans]|uniref:DUF5302 domain-containing protein n=1 Tax=Leucobacter denitrificans TaxID=683042 RepID=A0A7G9S2D3_9MICO|nr:DUF5302 domain-containing protein [Leucobacter denitrificans]QNN62008.1 DUF5302 domain-containing protein [Leucobacter denitrificans]